MKPIDFHDYWEHQNKLLELSYKESIRQREERRGKKMQEQDKCACNTKEKEQSGECCKQRPNALDEFWASLGDYHKCKTLTPKT